MSLLLFLFLCVIAFCLRFHYRTIRAQNRIVHLETGKPLQFAPWYESWLFILGLSNKNSMMEVNGDRDTALQGHWFHNDINVFVTDPKMTKRVLKSPDFDKTHLFVPGVDTYFKDGILFQTGEKWTRQKRKLTPAFTSAKVRSYQNEFITITETCLELFERQLKRRGGGEEDNSSVSQVDMENWIERFTFDVIGKVGFGFEFNALEDPNNPIYIESKKTFGSIVFGDAIAMQIPFNEKGRQMRGAFEASDDLIDSMCEQRRQIDPEIRKHEACGTILDCLLGFGEKEEEEKKSLTESEIKNNVFVFFLAGAETTVSALVSLFYYVSRNSGVGDRMRQELHTLLEDSGGIVRSEDISKMEYTEKVLKETLRLRTPTVVAGQRVAVKDTELGGYFIPEGTKVGCSLSCVHTNPDTYGDDSLEFKPERWDQIHSDNPHEDQLNYIPFSWGSRACIGKRFAWNEMMTFLGMFFYRYSISSDPEYVLRNKKLTVTQRPVERIMFHVERVEPQ